MSRPACAIGDQIEYILGHPKGREFNDLRDRAAYMYVTGTYPSHLRGPSTRLLTGISRLSNCLTSMDQQCSSVLIDEDIRQRLSLDQHPMVLKVREYIAAGFRITVSRGMNTRMPYTKIFLSRGLGREAQKITVQIDASVLDGWNKADKQQARSNVGKSMTDQPSGSAQL